MKGQFTKMAILVSKSRVVLCIYRMITREVNIRFEVDTRVTKSVLFSLFFFGPGFLAIETSYSMDVLCIYPMMTREVNIRF